MSKKEEYIAAKRNLQNVSRGGKDHHSCSFMDISVRIDRVQEAKKEYAMELGMKIIEEQDNENGR